MVELPFTTEQFLDVFRNYNGAIWPAQIVAYLLGILAFSLAIWKCTFSDKVISSILTVFWLWTGVVYHLAFFSEINKAAYLFGTLFIVQGLLFLIAGPVRNTLSFRLRGDAYGIVGAVLILYAMVIYPLLGLVWGHVYPAAPMFGVAPCPATIFTFGLLLWTVTNVPGWLLIIPGMWAVVGFMAAFKLGIREDLGLLIAGAVGIAMLLYSNRKRKGAKITADGDRPDSPDAPCPTKSQLHRRTATLSRETRAGA